MALYSLGFGEEQLSGERDLNTALKGENTHGNFADVLMLASGARVLKMEPCRRLARPLSHDNMQISINHSKFLRKLLLNANFLG